MTMKERADLGFADALDDFDPAEWSPKKSRNTNPRPEKAETRQAAAVAGFRSREPRPDPERAGEGLPRRRRTGRNAQFNLKARPETIAAFCAVLRPMFSWNGTPARCGGICGAAA